MKFRDLVQKLTDENDMLRKNLEEESSKSIPGLAEALDFKVSILKPKCIMFDSAKIKSVSDTLTCSSSLLTSVKTLVVLFYIHDLYL